MFRKIIASTVLMAAIVGWSMDAEARNKHKKHHKNHPAPAHYYHHGAYRDYGRHRHRGHSRRYQPGHYYPRHHYYTTHYRTRYYVPQRRVYVYGPPPPGIAFEYFRPDKGLWISVGF